MMAEPHVIRLRGPWLCHQGSERSDPSSRGAAATRIDYQAARGLSEFLEPPGEGILVLCRRFHCPTGLQHAASVRLIVDSSIRSMRAALNDTPLGRIEIGRYEFEIRDRLRTSNRLTLELATDEARHAGSLQDLFRVVVEIRPAPAAGARE